MDIAIIVLGAAVAIFAVLGLMWEVPVRKFGASALSALCAIALFVVDFDVAMFLLAAGIVLCAALGVVLFRNPVHAALSLIASFFGVAVLFIIQEAHFLALVQVVVYGGAIVVLFLFVIMLLGVDRTEDLTEEPFEGQRVSALVAGTLVFVMLMGGIFLSGNSASDDPGAGRAAISGSAGQVVPMTDDQDVVQLGRDLFTRNILAFEATGLLLTIATVGAVVLVRNRGAEDLVVDEPGTASR